MSTEVLEKGLTDCHYFLQGICNKGVSCEFRHCNKAKISNVTCKDWMNSNCSNIVCPKKHPNKVGVNKFANTFSSSNILCKYFLTNSCNKGDNCPFSHEKPNQQKASPTIQDVSMEKSKGRMSRMNEELKRKLQELMLQKQLKDQLEATKREQKKTTVIVPPPKKTGGRMVMSSRNGQKGKVNGRKRIIVINHPPTSQQYNRTPYPRKLIPPKKNPKTKPKKMKLPVPITSLSNTRIIRKVKKKPTINTSNSMFTGQPSPLGKVSHETESPTFPSNGSSDSLILTSETPVMVTSSITSSQNTKKKPKKKKKKKKRILRRKKRKREGDIVSASSGEEETSSSNGVYSIPKVISTSIVPNIMGSSFGDNSSDFLEPLVQQNNEKKKENLSFDDFNFTQISPPPQQQIQPPPQEKVEKKEDLVDEPPKKKQKVKRDIFWNFEKNTLFEGFLEKELDGLGKIFDEDEDDDKEKKEEEVKKEEERVVEKGTEVKLEVSKDQDVVIETTQNETQKAMEGFGFFTSSIEGTTSPGDFNF